MTNHTHIHTCIHTHGGGWRYERETRSMRKEDDQVHIGHLMNYIEKQ